MAVSMGIRLIVQCKLLLEYDLCVDLQELATRFLANSLAKPTFTLYYRGVFDTVHGYYALQGLYTETVCF